MTQSAKSPSPTKDAVTRQQKIQAKVDRKDAKQKSSSEPRAMQAGARSYPEPPFPRQHHRKPGHEWKIEPSPLYDAPFYLG